MGFKIKRFYIYADITPPLNEYLSTEETIERYKQYLSEEQKTVLRNISKNDNRDTNKRND